MQKIRPEALSCLSIRILEIATSVCFLHVDKQIIMEYFVSKCPSVLLTALKKTTKVYNVERNLFVFVIGES